MSDAPDLERLIAERYPHGEWAVIFELAKGTGFKGAGGRIDAAAFNCWPSKGHHRLAFEVKRSRSDFLRELKKPAKRAWVEENFHQTWFVVPAGLVKSEEVPESWGLLAATKDGSKLRQAKVAMHRDIGPLPEDLALAAMRAVASALQQLQSKEITFEGATITQADLDQRVAKALEYRQGHLDDQVERAREQERALQRERETLLGPLRALADAVLEWEGRQLVNPRCSEPTTVTVDQVQEWLAAVGRVQSPQYTRRLTQARDALDELLGGSP